MPSGTREKTEELRRIRRLTMHKLQRRYFTRVNHAHRSTLQIQPIAVATAIPSIGAFRSRKHAPIRTNPWEWLVNY